MMIYVGPPNPVEEAKAPMPRRAQDGILLNLDAYSFVMSRYPSKKDFYTIVLPSAMDINGKVSLIRQEVHARMRRQDRRGSL
jgi:hypothetical protein